MKKSGILNREINSFISTLGHKDYLTVTDTGLPLPSNVPIADMCLTLGTPTIEEVLKALAEDIVVEGIIIAEEVKTESPEQVGIYEKIFPGVPISYLPDLEFIDETAKSRGVIRTGGLAHYSSVILIAGITY